MLNASSSTGSRRFAIAFSFPGERREFVLQVAREVAATYGTERVLYDKFHESEFARLDLDVYLPGLYRTESELIVVFLCAEYARKRWCGLEFRHIRQLIGSLDAERIMLVGLEPPGDLAPLGIVPGDGYLDVAERSPQEIAALVMKRHQSAAIRHHCAADARIPLATDGGEPISTHEQTGLEMVLIPSGTFEMGSRSKEGLANERPLRLVKLSAFELSKYPVTREQYERFLKEKEKRERPPFWNDRRFREDRHPVVGVTWDEANAYAHWAGLRLPTEAEWEYACRAGSDKQYCSGDTEEDLDQVGWFGGNSGWRLHEVGEKSPNRYGVHDLHGNIWEWCSDLYRSAYDIGDCTDPRGPKGGDDRVLRGGTWYDPAPLARSRYRLFHHPASVISSVGFRLARSVSSGE